MCTVFVKRKKKEKVNLDGWEVGSQDGLFVSILCKFQVLLKVSKRHILSDNLLFNMNDFYIIYLFIILKFIYF